MKMKIIVRVAVATFLLLSGCGAGNLSEDEARRLVEAQPGFAEVMCALPLSGGTGRAIVRDGGEYFVRYESCGPALHDAGMGVVGRAQEAHEGMRPISFPESARTEDRRVLVPCGSMRLMAVRGIATTGNVAQFTYEREVVLRQGVAEAVDVCFFELPELGAATREVTARRDDAGEWSLVVAAH